MSEISFYDKLVLGHISPFNKFKRNGEELNYEEFSEPDIRPQARITFLKNLVCLLVSDKDVICAYTSFILGDKIYISCNSNSNYNKIYDHIKKILDFIKGTKTNKDIENFIFDLCDYSKIKIQHKITKILNTKNIENILDKNIIEILQNIDDGYANMVVQLRIYQKDHPNINFNDNIGKSIPRFLYF